MKNILHLLFISLILASCSKDNASNDMDDEQEQDQESVFYYDNDWIITESDRVLPASDSHSSTITEKFEIQNKTYHRISYSTGQSGYVNLCEYDGTNWSQCNNSLTNFTMVKYQNTIFAVSNYIQSGLPLETKIFDSATFTFTNYSQEVPPELDDNVQYYTTTATINNELYLIAVSAIEATLSALKYNSNTNTWSVVNLQSPIDGTTFLQNSRVHQGLTGEALISGRTTEGDFVYRFNGSTFDTLHQLNNFTTYQAGGYFDIIPHNGKYIIADGSSGTLNYLDGMTATSEAFPTQGYIQHFTIKDNYACVAVGSPTGSIYSILNFRFYNLTNGKIAIFNPYIDKNGANFNSVGMEAPWFDYSFNNDQIQMLGAMNIVYPNFVGGRGATKFVMPVALP